MTVAPAPIKPPRTIILAIGAAAVQIVFTLLRIPTVWSSSADWKQYLIKSNSNLKATDKNKKSPYTAAEVSHDLHSLHTGFSVQALLVCVLVALAAYAFWRGRGIARWLYIIASVFFSATGITALTASSPQPFNITSFLGAIAAIAAIILLILPESARYFAAVKALRMPAGADPVARPAGLRGLFAPPPPRQPRPTAGAAAGTPRPPGLRGLFAPQQPRPDAAPSTGKRKPAVTRAAGTSPAAKPAPNGRAKPKARATSADAAPELPPADTTPARGRGKSRKV